MVEFVVDHVPLGEMDLGTRILLRGLGDNPLAYRLYNRIKKRIVVTAPSDADTLCNYAIYLVEQRGDLDGAEAYFKQALEVDPKHADTLCNYAIYLVEQRGDLDGAEAYFKQALEADPKHAAILGSYAIFLEEQRGDLDGAEVYYKRALEADPKHAAILSSYAIFLEEQRGDLDGAEVYYKCALEADPKDTNNLSNYAIFLEEQRGDLDGAEVYYKRAFEADPKDASNLGNYGQFLIGLARLSEGEKALLSAFEHLDQASVRNKAKICFSLWLVSRMQGYSAERWERYFKYFIQKGFKRHPWSFARMLDQAKKVLSPEEFEYAEALARAFLDESQVANLEQYERWRTLEPLNPWE